MRHLSLALRSRAAVSTVVVALFAATLSPLAEARPSRWTLLTQDDFRHGTYVIDRPGRYRLAEDISFNPNSPATLDAALASGALPADAAAQLGLAAPVDAYSAGRPLATQFAHEKVRRFTPGGPLDQRYDPAAYGLGFFAAISITAPNVVLDLNGYTIEQSEEHALLQRFFAVIELASSPFIPKQGPHDFGSRFKAARHVTIRNGTIGRSAHHGIHGNANRNVRIQNVEFRDYEVAAMALNGVVNLRVRDVEATNRKDVPIIGTYSSAIFIKPYLQALVRSGSTTTLNVGGEALDAQTVLDRLTAAVNAVHRDLIVEPNIVDGRAQIDAATNPDEYALFANRHGVVDGNAYSFLINSVGIAVNGFAKRQREPARNIRFKRVFVDSQHAFINEVVTLAPNGKPVTDPVGAVFQVFNAHPDTGAPVTVTDLDPANARYSGNVIANAQALVAKAAANGEFEGTRLDVSRLSIDADVLGWVEGVSGFETLASIVPTPAHRLCNGDSMFHVNKGVIGFLVGGARNVRLYETEVNDIRNFGAAGSGLCGDYSDAKSHGLATLDGYGGAATRAYAIAGSEYVDIRNAYVDGVYAEAGSATGVDVMTDSRRVIVRSSDVFTVEAGLDGAPGLGGLDERVATGYTIGADARRAYLRTACSMDLDGRDGQFGIDDASGGAVVRNRRCP